MFCGSFSNIEKVLIIDVLLVFKNLIKSHAHVSHDPVLAGTYTATRRHHLTEEILNSKENLMWLKSWQKSLSKLEVREPLIINP